MMMVFIENNIVKLKITTALLAVASISACTTGTTAPTLVAGAPSTHVPLNYETNTSTAAVISNTAGSTFIVPISGSAPSGPPTLAGSVGTVNHQTGRITLDDGTYLFIDPDGPTLTGAVADGAGATGSTLPVTGAGAATYDYVNSYELGYVVGGQQYYALGYAGIVTGGADMPDGGSATYTGAGTAIFQTVNLSGINSSTETFMDGGDSTVTVDFAAGSATVNMSDFTNMADGLGNPYLVGANPIDQIQGTGLVVSGAQLSGGAWVTIKNGSPVSLLGASAVATSEGTFFGYDPSISAPDEIAGLMLITGATQMGVGVYVAD